MVLKSWLGEATIGDRTVICLPAQSSGTWLAASYLPPDHHLLDRPECRDEVESQLRYLSSALKVKRKSPLEYRKKSTKITENWGKVKAVCSQAQAFEVDVLATLADEPLAR